MNYKNICIFLAKAYQDIAKNRDDAIKTDNFVDFASIIMHNCPLIQGPETRRYIDDLSKMDFDESEATLELKDLLK